MWEKYCAQPWSPLADLLLCGLATLQLLRLWDKLTVAAAIRAWVDTRIERNPVEPSKLCRFWEWLAELLSCTFCLSHWLTAGCLLLRYFGGWPGFYLLLWLATVAVVNSLLSLAADPTDR